MAVCFALGSTCFLIGPFPGYAQLVGESTDAITFIIGSILFTAGGGLQQWLAWSGRHSPGGSAGWWAAIVQSAGTLFFNVTTYEAMHNALTSPTYNKLVWRPDWRRVDLLPRLRCNRLPRLGASWLAAGARRPGLVAAGSQPARLRLLWNLGRCGLRRSVHRGRCSTRRRRTGTPRSGRRASWPARSTRCTPTGLRSCRTAGELELRGLSARGLPRCPRAWPA